MAKYGNTGTRIYLDQYDISGFLNATDFAVKQETTIVTTFSDEGPRRLVGNYDHSGSSNGFIDTADNSFDENILAHVGSASDHYLTRLFGANAEGSVSYDAVVTIPTQPRTAQIGQAILLNITDEGTNGASRGMVIRSATISANDNGTGRNVGASTAGQTFQVVIRVLSGTFTSFDVNIQESQNDGAPDAYATVADLSQTGIAAGGVWRKTTTSATEAWKRVNIANWIGTSAVVLVTCGVVAGT